MKKVVLTFLFVVMHSLFSTFTAKAQICNPYYQYYVGFGYMPIPNGYYIGDIYYGYAHGYGYIYCYDMTTGWTAYQGGFYGGLPHGQGQLLCNLGYIAGVWDKGNLLYQVNVNQNQINQTYNNMVQQSETYAPENSNKISLPPGTEIKEIESSSELGRKLLGKMRK